MVHAEGDVCLLHLTLARALVGDTGGGRAVARVAVALEVEEREAAHVAHALDVDGEGADELEDLRRAARQREEKQQRRGDAAEDLLLRVRVRITARVRGQGSRLGLGLG